MKGEYRMLSISKQSGKETAYLTEYIADTAADVANLPHIGQCAVGSTCFVIEASAVYMLGNDDVWHEI